jgi:RHS repeat-associated protein
MRDVSRAYAGSVRQTVDAAGNLIAARAWTPYGVEFDGAQPGLGYAGEWFDAAVGLQYLRARWYDVEVGRFTQSDAIMNTPTYQYASANPINRIDPSGYIDWSACVIIGAYGTCVIEQGDTLYKIARELQGAGIQSQVGLAQVVRDIIGYNPTIQGNPDYIRLGDQLALPADWIRALQPSTEFPTIDAI